MKVSQGIHCWLEYHKLPLKTNTLEASKNVG